MSKSKGQGRGTRAARDDAEAGGILSSLGGSIETLIQAAMMYGTTGRSIVILEDVKSGVAALNNVAGIQTISTADYDSGMIPAEDVTDEAIVLPDLKVVILSASGERGASMATAAGSEGIRTIIPETLVWIAANGGPPPGMFAGAAPPFAGARSLDYWQGYIAGMSQVIAGLGGGPGAWAAPGLPGGFAPVPIPLPWGAPTTGVADADTSAAGTGAETWALRVTKVFSSGLTGAGVKVAVLDTGLDLGHPDFQDGRVVATASFVGEPVQDVPTRGIPGVTNDQPGHGTHCIGLACGPRQPTGPSAEGRYGVASGAQICVGKVLTNRGISVSGSVLQGIQWAIQQKCHIISMSLSGKPQGGDPYQTVAEAAVRNGIAIIAAVGNDSNRPGLPGFNPNRPSVISPVGSPANSLRIMGAGAVDSNLRLAAFSNRGQFGTAAAVDIVGPGFQVYSSLPRQAPAGMANTYGRLSGTSMATPIVAGIAALLKEAKPDFGPIKILQTLQAMAQRLQGTDQNDTGSGLVQAPQ